MFVEDNLELVAEELRITVEELEALEFDEGDHTSSDGLTYYYWMTFRDGNPPEIMAKVRGLSGNMVQFSPTLFE